MYSWPTADAAAQIVLQGDDSKVADLLHLIQTTGENPKPLLGELASHEDPVVRAWALGAIGVSIRAAGVDILVAHAKSDRDTDVQSIAIEELLEVDVDAARKLAPKYRPKLKSADIDEPVTAMWMLASVRDYESLEAVRAIREGADRGFHRKVATVVCMILEGKSDEILAGIRSHNHDLMPWLARAAGILGTLEALEALQQCANAPIDEECKWSCRSEAEELSQRIRRGSRRA